MWGGLLCDCIVETDCETDWSSAALLFINTHTDVPSISQFTLQSAVVAVSLSVTRSPLEMSQMSHWRLKYYHWLDIHNWCTVYTDPQNMMKDSLRRRVGSFPSCHVWVHWRLRVSNVFHYGGTAAGYIDSEDQFCWVSGHEEGGHATTQEERGQ